MSNPSLSSLISKWLGTEAWIRNVDLLAGLRDHASNPVLQQEWRMVLPFTALYIYFLMKIDRLAFFTVI